MRTTALTIMLLLSACSCPDCGYRPVVFPTAGR